MEKEELKAREKKIAEMAIKYCKEYIDEEYALLCERQCTRKEDNVAVATYFFLFSS